jgi:hypothetical protein
MWYLSRHGVESVMVMRNRHDGPGSPGWGERLPPRVRERCAGRPRETAEFVRKPAAPAAPNPALDVARELSHLALLFLAVAVANILFLLVALSLVADGSATPFAPPPHAP